MKSSALSRTLFNSICGADVFYHLVANIYCSIGSSKYSNFYSTIGSPVHNTIISFSPKIEYNIINLINVVNNASQTKSKKD